MRVGGPAGLELEGENPWQTLATAVAWQNERLRVREDAVLQPDGIPGTYTLVELPYPVVVIVPLDADGRVHLVRQWRYPWGRNSWEVPAGHCEVGEAPDAAARRELAEEVGLSAGAWEPLGTVHASAIMAVPFHLYLARELAPTERVGLDGSERDLIARAVPLAEAVEAAMDGRIVHAVTALALLRTARRLGV